MPMPMPWLTAIVLAAGSSQRMESRNKLLLDFGGKPLVAHVVKTIVAAGLEEVVVVVGHEANRVRNVLVPYPVTFVHNERYPEGMSTSIHAGVNAASEEAAGYMICLADLPLIEPAELRVLIRAFNAALEQDDKHIVVPYHAGERGNPVVFPVYYKPAILAQRGLMGCRGLIEQHRDHVVAVEMETDHILVDIDTPEAYLGLRNDLKHP